MEYAIETRGLTKVYDSLFFWKKKVHALSNLSLSVPEGSIFGFLGPNGAGKTTTIKLLMDLLRPTSGSASIFGKPPSDIETKLLIGFLPDSPAFGTHLTARDFLNICAKLLKIPSDSRKERIAQVLERVKMTGNANSRLGSFSRGMLQRIGIAQAILNNPRLLILDEPLLGLDPHGRQDLKEIILSQREAGSTVFFSSHILNDVEQICDHIAILRGGSLLCQGRLDALLSAVGFRVRIDAACAEAAGELLPLAKESSRLPDGAWQITLDDSPAVRAKLNSIKAKNPDALSESASRESLEDFFFRKIEES